MLDHRYATALLGMLKPGETLFAEDLRFHQGPDANGNLRRALAHTFDRRHRSVAFVNAAYSSVTCIACGGRCTESADRRIRCDTCGREWDRDEAAAVTIARRGMLRFAGRIGKDGTAPDDTKPGLSPRNEPPVG